MRDILLAAAVGLLLMGCESNDQYRSANFSGDKVYSKKAPIPPQLKENDVLGLRNTRATKDSDIGRILDEVSSLQIKEGSRILLVQSGSEHPDKEMVDELSKRFVVVPYTGLPNQIRSDDGDDIGKSLRLAAAQSKAETLMVYWGHLEMRRDDLPTSLVSWVPVIDFSVPDEYQRVRMHLKVALVDVRTGKWSTFRSEPVESDALTTRFAREHEQKWPIKNTKQRLYRESVQKLLDGYVMAKN
ncbi:MAG TPA: hypothetical protein VF773_09020 [Verrucomicrobiae bacterium]